MRNFNLIVSVAVAISAGVGAASAADLAARPYTKAAPMVDPANNWSGFYVGANVGGGWGTDHINYAANDALSSLLFGFGGAPPPAAFRTSGAVGGLQLGYNWQFNRNWLIGLEADLDWSDVKSSGSTSGVLTVGPAATITANFEEHVRWFGTARVRLGFEPAPNLLTYATGGFAYGQVARSGSYTTTSSGGFLVGTLGGVSANCLGPGTCFSGSSNNVAIGWTVGGGVEYAISNNVSFKGEYLYVSLAGSSLNQAAVAVLTPGTPPSTISANYGQTNFNVVRIGMNYRFGGPVVAKY